MGELLRLALNYQNKSKRLYGNIFVLYVIIINITEGLKVVVTTMGLYS